ncbi:MAG: DUF4956 domain-containing protein [Bacteroidia bacterium]
MTILQIIDESITVPSLEAVTKISFKLGARILIDILSVFILVRYIYFPIYRHREYFFMFVIFNLIIFLVSFLLNKVELSMGAAFGLFAVFSMLRYRTDNISIKDMTYLFLCIAIGLVSAVTKIKGAPDNYEYLFLIGINLTILAITYLLESKIFNKKEHIKTIIYENIELIQSNRQEELLADIRQRTGIDVHRVSVQQINFLKDSAQLKIYYYE